MSDDRRSDGETGRASTGDSGRAGTEAGRRHLDASAVKGDGWTAVDSTETVQLGNNYLIKKAIQ